MSFGEGKTINLLGDRVWIEQISGQEKTKGGLFLPPSSVKKLDLAVVRGIGPDVCEVKVGDHICYDKFMGTEIDEKTRILKEENIVAIVDITEEELKSQVNV